MQGGRPPQPSGTNRPSSSACPSHGRSRGTRRLRALCGPQGTVEGGTPEAERPQTASGHGRGGTPGPIPNPEVKPPSADCTAGRARGRPGRRWPTGGVFATGGAPRRARGPSPFFEWKCGAADSSFCTNAVRSGNQSLLLGRVFKQTSRLAWCVNWVSRWRLRLCFIACFRALVHFLVIAHLHW